VAKNLTDSKLEKLIRQNEAEQAKFKFKKDLFAANRFGPLVFLLAFGVIGSLLAFNTFAASDPQAGGGQAKGRIWLLSDRSVATLDNSITVQVWADNAGQAVNAMMAQVEYPDDKLQFVQSDTPPNRQVQTQVVNTGRKVVIARTGDDTETSSKRITSLTFKPKAMGDVSLRILADKSEIRRSSDDVDILGASEGVRLTVTE
jgi:hypothetical protein